MIVKIVTGEFSTLYREVELFDFQPDYDEDGNLTGDANLSFYGKTEIWLDDFSIEKGHNVIYVMNNEGKTVDTIRW